MIENRQIRALDNGSACDSLSAGVKTHAPALFSHLEDDYFSELGSVEKEVDRNVIVKMLTEKPEPVQDENPVISLVRFIIVIEISFCVHCIHRLSAWCFSQLRFDPKGLYLLT